MIQAIKLWPPGNCFSPYTTKVDEAAYTKTSFPGIDLRVEQQLALAEECRELPTVEYSRYPGIKSQMFSEADAFWLSAMLRYHKPKSVLEVGSGHSTGVILDTAEHLSPFKLITVDPDMGRVQKSWSHPNVEMISKDQEVQTLGVDPFLELEAGDILFIDSSHVCKTGSDVNFLYLEVIPQLKPGVIVHAHDIFWPFEYPRIWVQEGRSWNEIYLLRALLIGKVMDILLWPSCLAGVEVQPLENSGSIWMVKT
jgi:predicted O-methyltransferase YrrM